MMTTMNENIYSENLEIAFDQLKQSLAVRGRSRLMWQFKSSPVINDLLQKFSLQLQDCYDVAIGVLDGRTLAKAQGVNLDIIGSIVGQSRIFSNAELTAFFTPDKGGWGADQVGVWVTNADRLGKRVMSDYNYRNLILAKIFKNHSIAGSNPENRYCAQFISDFPMSFIKVGLQRYKLAFPVGVGVGTLLLLRTSWKNTQVDSYYLLPIPATVQLDVDIAYLLPMDDGYSIGFGPDIFETRPDYAKAAICINIGDLK